MHGDLEVERATSEDAGELLVLQRAAYVSEAQLYNNPHLPALVQSLQDLAAEIASILVLKVRIGHRIVGSVRVRANNGISEVGRLIVAPDMQGRGIGTALMNYVHSNQLPETAHFEVFTGHLSEANLRLYRTLGYTETRRQTLDASVELVFMRRPATARP